MDVASRACTLTLAKNARGTNVVHLMKYNPRQVAVVRELYERYECG